MEVTNFSLRNRVKRNNSSFLPSNLRGLIIGKSSSGKSTLLYNLLLKPWLDYDNLMVFGNSLHQSEYQIIKSGFEHGLEKEQIANVFMNQEQLLEAGISPFRAIEEYTGPKNNDITANFFYQLRIDSRPFWAWPRQKKSSYSGRLLSWQAKQSRSLLFQRKAQQLWYHISISKLFQTSATIHKGKLQFSYVIQTGY